MEKEICGRLIGVYLGAEKGAAKTCAESAELIADHGLRGDSHAGRNPRRQVSLFAAERLQELQSEGFKVSADQIAANLITENIELDLLRPQTRLRIGETELEIVE